MKVLDSKNNFLGLDKKFSSIENSSALIIPLIKSSRKEKINHPYKLIFEASKKLEKYDEEMSSELCFEKGISSLSPIKLPTHANAIDINKDEFLKHINAKKIFLSLSNEIDASSYFINLFKQAGNDFSILHLDAKARLKNDWQTKNSNDKLINNLIVENFDVVQCGIRNISKEEVDFKNENLIKQFLSVEIKLGMFGELWQELVAKELKENVFIIINLSVFDPSVFDIIENPEPSGLSWEEVIYLLKIIGQDKNIIGVDLSGISFKKKSNSNYFVSKLIYKILNYALK